MSLKYGCITPNPKGRQYPVAASQYFAHAGIGFVHLDSSGHVTLSLTATATLFGYVEAPAGVGAGAAGSAYWKSSATAGADHLFVITDKNAEFLVPGNITATAAMLGGAWDILSVNDGTAGTADLDTSTTDVLIATELGTNVAHDAAATDVVVMMNEAKRQSDT